MLMRIDENRMRKIDKLIIGINEVVGEWEIRIDGCPIDRLRVKVIRLGRNSYLGKANYAIQNPTQLEPYRSIHNPHKTVQEALEDAIQGFMGFYDPKMKEKTKYILIENF